MEVHRCKAAGGGKSGGGDIEAALQAAQHRRGWHTLHTEKTFWSGVDEMGFRMDIYNADPYMLVYRVDQRPRVLNMIMMYIYEMQLDAGVIKDEKRLHPEHPTHSRKHIQRVRRAEQVVDHCLHIEQNRCQVHAHNDFHQYSSDMLSLPKDTAAQYQM